MNQSELTKKGTIRKRKPKTSNNYFTQDTEDAILEFRECKDEELRNKIYDTRIKYAFFKLTENIIHTFKFYYTDVEHIEELQHEVIIFLLEKLNLYKQHKGKAYSYFGTITKRYLINYNKNNYKKRINKTDIDEIVKNEDKVDNQFIVTDNEYMQREKNLEFFESYIKYVSENLDDLFPQNSKNKKSPVKDIQIVDVILEIFRKRNAVIIFNKKALYHSIREMLYMNTNHDVSTPHITYVTEQMKEIYVKLYWKYQNYEPPFDKIEENIFI